MTASLPQTIIKRAAKLRTAPERFFRKKVGAKCAELELGLRTEAGKRELNAERAASSGKGGQP